MQDNGSKIDPPPPEKLLSLHADSGAHRKSGDAGPMADVLQHAESVKQGGT